MAVELNACFRLLPVPGLRLGTASAGVKKPERRDLVIMELIAGAHSSAVFTRNAFCAAPVTIAKRHHALAEPRYLLINTGNANAGTGGQGLRDAESCCAELARLTGVSLQQVLPFSTGVIGEPLPVDKIKAGLPAALQALRADAWVEAAQAIMTTDTVAKGDSRQLVMDGRAVTVTGIAKGAGMIHPNMATMLAYVVTDAALTPTLLKQCLDGAVAASFNAITVDGDTSTNDACVLIATGKSGIPLISDASDPRYICLRDAVTEVCTQLAQAIVRDGEGATKFITVEVCGGDNGAECRQVAYAIATSPLVKTAFFACDPNWGRILAAIGRVAVQDLDVARIHVYLDEVCIVSNGERAADYREEQGQRVMRRPEITVKVDLRRGNASARIWTCDFSYDYVRINAEYRS